MSTQARDAVDAAAKGGGKENGLSSALGLLSTPFTGLPSLSGGDAAPSFAQSDAAGWVLFNNPFSITGTGDANSSADANPTSRQPGGISTNMLVLAGMGLGAFILLR